MTNAEARYEFKLKVNALDSSAKANWLPNAMDSYLSKANLLWVKEVAPEQETFQGARDKLGSLFIIGEQVVPTNNIIPLSALSQTYYRVEEILVDITGTCSRTGIKAYPFQKDDNYTAFDEPSLQWGNVPYSLGTTSAGKSIIFDTNNLFTVSNAYISYIRKPSLTWGGDYNHINGTLTVGQTALPLDVDDAYADEVIRIAAELALTDINPQFHRVELDKANTK